MTLVRAALTVLSAALVAPLLHLAPLPPRVDRFVASVLDGLSNNSRLVTSEKLRLAGGSLFNPEGYHGPESSSTSGSTSDGFFEGSVCVLCDAPLPPSLPPFSRTCPASSARLCPIPPDSTTATQTQRPQRWYFKFHTADGETVVAIPGIIFAKGGGGFSFVMCAVPSATEPAQRYALHKYKLADFRHSASPNTGEWRIMIGPDGENSFGHDGFTLDLKSGGQSVKGRVELASTTPYPATLALPDVMGWFAYLPAMECRHGVVSLHSKLKGGLELNGGAITSFDGGLGYGEEDCAGCSVRSPPSAVRRPPSAVRRPPRPPSAVSAVRRPPSPPSAVSAVRHPPSALASPASSPSSAVVQRARHPHDPTRDASCYPPLTHPLVEKDWGSQFPRTWVWLQSSHFVDPDTKAPVQATLMLSIASIPWPSEKRELTRFRGFLGCLYAPQHGGLYPFGTP